MGDIHGVICKGVGCFINKEYVRCVEIIESVFFEIKDVFNFNISDEGLVTDSQGRVIGLVSEIRGECQYHINEMVWYNEIEPNLA